MERVPQYSWRITMTGMRNSVTSLCMVVVVETSTDSRPKRSAIFDVQVLSESILTYRNNPSYTAMGILIFLSVRSNTDQIRMKFRIF